MRLIIFVSWLLVMNHKHNIWVNVCMGVCVRVLVRLQVSCCVFSFNFTMHLCNISKNFKIALVHIVATIKPSTWNWNELHSVCMNGFRLCHVSIDLYVFWTLATCECEFVCLCNGFYYDFVISLENVKIIILWNWYENGIEMRENVSFLH